MKKRTLVGALCFSVLVLVVSAPADAGDLTLFGGFHHPGKVTLGSVNQLPGTGAAITDPKDFGVFGVRINTGGSLLGFENTLAFSPNFVSSDAWALIQSSNILIGIPTWVSPYATAGMGGIFTGGQGPADFGSKFAVNYGGGIKVSLKETIGIRGDVRGYSILALQGQTLNVVETSVGIMIGF